MQVYLLRRSSTSPFMPGTYVFPGGGLEDEDRDLSFWIKHVDLAGEQLTHALGGQPERMLPFAVAAFRETWEEAGLLLTEPSMAATAREDRPDGKNAFKQLIQTRRLRLPLSTMGCWRHWITPESMPRRFDTYFFLAPVERDQQCRPDSRETVHGIWITAYEALKRNERGTLPLSPPTLVTLHQMLPYADRDAIMTAVRGRSWLAPIMPRLWPLEKGALIIEPWDPEYECDNIVVDADRLEMDVLPVGTPFSRLWYDGRIFRPVTRP